MKLRTQLAAGFVAAALLLTGMFLAGPLLSLFDSSGPATGSAAFRSSIQLDSRQYSSEAEEHALIQKLELINTDQAEAIALAAHASATIVNVELANINGSVVYEVDLENGTEIFIDAGNGEILSTE